MEPPDIFYVVIELKVVDFMPDFIGKLYFCVSAADELLKGDDGNPSIGILLCKDKDSSAVEWSLRGVTTPLGVASYQLQEGYMSRQCSKPSNRHWKRNRICLMMKSVKCNSSSFPARISWLVGQIILF